MCYFTEMICVLHDDDKSKNDTTKIIPFNKESLEKCQNILKIRYKAGLKYSSKTLPDDLNNKYGYHISRYRWFVALPFKYRDETTADNSSSDTSITDINFPIRGKVNEESSLCTRSKCTSLKPLSGFRKEMDKSIAIIKTNKGKMLFSTSMTAEDAIKRKTKNSKTTSIKEKLGEVAFILRRTIMDAETTPLPEKITVADIANGEIDVPDILEEFMTNSICVPNYRRQTDTKKGE